jgi:2-haloacid dehalogenase
MSMSNVKALCFDTGGTILDWHTGMRTALAAVGARHGVERDWAKLANEFRRRSLKLIVNHGAHAPATMTFDDAHRDALDQVLADNGLDVFSEGERRSLWWDAIHGLKCWPDFPDSLARLRGKFMCVSFTLLSFRIVMDTARRNGISWDAVISCEAIGKYKVLPEAYKTCAKFLQLDPSECCMVACHRPAATGRPSCAGPMNGARKGRLMRSLIHSTTLSLQASLSLRKCSGHDRGFRVRSCNGNR